MAAVSKKLPETWSETPIGEICSLVNGRAFKPAEWREKGVPIVRIQNLKDSNTSFNYCDIKINDRFHVHNGDLLFAWSGTPGTSFGAHVWFGSLAYLNQHIFRLDFNNSYIHRDFFKYALNERLGEIIAKAQGGVGLRHITKSGLENVKILFPPLNEQKRIVARIEELQARSRSARKALEIIPDLLDQLRQSILVSAFRGNLTKEWREKNPNIEPATELLKRIRAEHRKRWEEAELKKLKSKGLTEEKLKEAFAARRKQYKEPAPIDTSDLPELPKGWCWASIGEISQWVTDGTHQPPPFTDSGIPFLVISNMVSGDIAWNTVQKWVSTETYDKYTGSYKPALGDIIYSTVGSYGVAVEVKTNEKFMFQRHIAHIRPISKHLSASYLSFTLNAPICRQQADAVARGVAQKTVNLFDLKRFAIPLAPLSEQHKLNELLSKCFEKLDNHRHNLNSSLDKLHNFEQSILAMAFHGELVPQDPNDEPASALLERIRQEKASAAVDPKVKAKQKGRKLHHRQMTARLEDNA
jgi:type I restriction enzyme S subunit